MLGTRKESTISVRVNVWAFGGLRRLEGRTTRSIKQILRTIFQYMTGWLRDMELLSYVRIQVARIKVKGLSGLKGMVWSTKEKGKTLSNSVTNATSNMTGMMSGAPIWLRDKNSGERGRKSNVLYKQFSYL